MSKPTIVLSPEEIARVQKMAGQGLTNNQIAKILGFSKKTLERMEKRDAAFNDAIEKGRAEATDEVTKTAYRMAVSGRHPAMTMFWLKCRQRWSEVQKIEHSGPDGKPIEHKDLTDLPDDVLDAKINALLAKDKA